MSISSTLDRLHLRAKENSWLWVFSVFCRFTLALGFFPAGMVKIIGERFASGLSANHPMGHYLEALHTTGYYYTFIGVVQIAAAIMLLIPRTVTLGAFLYFPIILNICILTFATRFDGSFFTAPLMTLANLYLLGWNYEKWKYILPFNHQDNCESERKNADDRGFFSRYVIGEPYARFRGVVNQLFSRKFPFLKNFPYLFFAGVFASVVFFVLVVPQIIYRIKPRNTLIECQRQFKDSRRIVAGNNFCNCIHQNAEPLDKCLNDYNVAPDDSNVIP